MDNSGLGIDTTRIYFREDIALMWGRDGHEDKENLRRWFKENFINKGLKTFSTGGRISVHGRELSEWQLRNSIIRDD